ncbi:hypothetical protein L2Y96_16880 [Luteibacter aegosomaticola]|uniref:hypothetical protein n=1 Tax=Luteibacter aegosomaticola TaxID=2911538 RepID=UPI001FF9FC01|nr:hypothetical protein [Luteibacter aegosomaticola]UPG89058.1 hypothetical protein L2Y96_16880 [Luteibacter aegosomaticola]
MSERVLEPVSVVVITVDHTDAVEAVVDYIEALVDSGSRVALTGDPRVIARMRPPFARAWPATNTVVLDASATLGISGIDARDETERDALLQRWPWDHDVLPHAGGTVRRAPDEAVRRRQHVEFSVLATSPSAVCGAFSRNMAAALFGTATPGGATRRAFRREVRRWCQYGTLSSHAAEPAQFTIEPFRHADEVVLNLDTEWALMRNEPTESAENTTYIFWTRTMGEGAGTGFSRRHGSDGWYDPDTRVVRDLLDAAIHSGWGPIEGRDVVTAWPLNSSFPAVGNVHVFRCDAPNAFRPYECPLAPRLRKLYPDDTHDGMVTVSAGEALSVSGDAGVTRTVSTDGASTHVTLAMSVGRATSSTTQVAQALVDIRSNADTVSYRSTWWRPDVPAIQQWIDARKHSGSLVKATALASTLNPRHEMVWELPLRGNSARDLPYHVVYEAGWNTCINATHCKDHSRYPMPDLPVKARVGWSDGMVLTLPRD